MTDQSQFPAVNEMLSHLRFMLPVLVLSGLPHAFAQTHGDGAEGTEMGP